MWKWIILSMSFAYLATGCAGTSYGASTDGTFPLRPAGAEYPGWEHMCIVFTATNATETLQSSGEKGWELVAIGKQGGDDLMCFKRPKTGA